MSARSNTVTWCPARPAGRRRPGRRPRRRSRRPAPRHRAAGRARGRRPFQVSRPRRCRARTTPAARQHDHRRRMGERVGPGPAAGRAGGHHPARHRRPRTRPARPRDPRSRGDRRHDVGQRERAGHRRGRAGAATRTPPTATCCSPSRSSAQPSYIRQVASRGAVGQRDPAAGPLDRPRQRDVLEHLGRAPPRARPRGRSAARVDHQELPVRGGQRRAAASVPSRAAAGRSATTTAAAAAPAARRGAVASWRGYGDSRSSPASRRTVTAAATACGREHARRRRRRPARCPGPRPASCSQACGLPSQPGGRRRPGEQAHAGVAAGDSRARRRPVPSVDPSSRTTHLAGPGRRAGPAGARRQGATRCASSRSGSATVTASATSGGAGGGTRRRRRFSTWWAVPATASADPTRTTHEAAALRSAALSTAPRTPSDRHPSPWGGRRRRSDSRM